MNAIQGSVLEETKKIELVFPPGEGNLYFMLEKHCASKNISMENYLKELLIRDLSWGHFARKKKPRQGEAD